jgi:hypothetical protein
VNLACQAVLSELKTHPFVPSTASTSTDCEVQAAQQRYSDALEKDLIGSCRGIVTACRRASGQRRQELQNVIREGNEMGYWKGKLPDGMEKLPLLQLLRDCETRWSSTYLMIERILLLYPVSVTASPFGIQIIALTRF